RAHGADERPGNRLQHWTLRQRDPGRTSPRAQGHQANEYQAAGGQVYFSRRPRALHAGGRTAGEPRLRYRPSELRHVELVLEPGARATRSLEKSRHLQGRGLCALETARRRSGAPPLGKDWGEADQADRQTGRVPRRAYRMSIQVIALPLLTFRRSTRSVP